MAIHILHSFGIIIILSLTIIPNSLYSQETTEYEAELVIKEEIFYLEEDSISTKEGVLMIYKRNHNNRILILEKDILGLFLEGYNWKIYKSKYLIEFIVYTSSMIPNKHSYRIIKREIKNDSLFFVDKIELGFLETCLRCSFYKNYAIIGSKFQIDLDEMKVEKYKPVKYRNDKKE